jgi:alkanesulfonate monooxygenase SsuD/methylene tetrahydromethanopterin reductase-like flavin-dependent oxidoreductase (luciferase family)
MLEPQLGMSVGDIVRCAKYAENAGYGSIFRSDHILPTPGWGAPADSPECWVSLGALAAETRSVAFGPMVSPIGFRNPALLAKMACTIHSYSMGRLLLGVGAGWFKEEYLAHGMEFPGFKVRLEQLEEALKIIRPLTQGESVDFEGKYFRAKTDCLPKPHGKVHLILGGKNTHLLRLIARYADEWNIVTTTPKDTKALLAKLASEHPERAITVSQMRPLLIVDGGQQVMESRLKLYTRAWRISGDISSAGPKLRAGGVLYGSVEEIAGQINELRDAGIEKFYLNVLDGRDEAMMDSLTHMLKEKF